MVASLPRRRFAPVKEIKLSISRLDKCYATAHKECFGKLRFWLNHTTKDFEKQRHYTALKNTTSFLAKKGIEDYYSYCLAQLLIEGSLTYPGFLKTYKALENYKIYKALQEQEYNKRRYAISLYKSLKSSYQFILDEIDRIRVINSNYFINIASYKDFIGSYLTRLVSFPVHGLTPILYLIHELQLPEIDNLYSKSFKKSIFNLKSWFKDHDDTQEVLNFLHSKQTDLKQNPNYFVRLSNSQQVFVIP